MASNLRLFWEHGTLLQPQHFQCLDAQFQDTASLLAPMTSPWPWGIIRLEIQEDALPVGLFALTRLDAMLPEGEHVVLGGNAVAAPRDFGELWPDPAQPLDVYLGLPPQLEFGANVTECDIHDSAACLGATTRFVALPEAQMVPDRLADGEPADVRFMHYNVHILFGSESDKLATMPHIPLARLVHEGENVRLAPDFCPPCLDINASPILVEALKAVRHATVARAKQLEDFKILPDIVRNEAVAGGTALAAQTLVLYSMLGVLSRHAPLLEHLCEAPHIHPWPVYGLLRQLAGELSLFAADLGPIGTTASGERAIPAYSHTNLAECFLAAKLVITRLVDTLAAGPAHTFAFEYNGQHWFCRLPTFARTGYDFWLQIHTTNPAQLRALVTASGKFAPEHHLSALVARSLPGVRLFPADQPPPGLPRRDDICYFAVDRTDPMWGDIIQSGNPAIFLPGVPEGTSVRLMLMPSAEHTSQLANHEGRA